MKRMTNKYSITTGQFSYYQFEEKYLKDSFNDLLEENKLLSEHQSGFCSHDSCISQLLPIVHKVYSSFDAYPALETRGILLDISKAFDKVWYEGLIYKLKHWKLGILY